MANIPQYRLPTVQQQGVRPTEGYKMSPHSPNQYQGLAEGIGQAADIMAREQLINDQMRVEEAFNKLRERQLDLTFNQQNGYANIEGKNALPQDDMTLSDRYTGNFQAAANELRESLGNDRQKQMFQRFADRAGVEFKSGVMRHENAQVDKWRKQTIDGVFAVESDNAAKNWNNPEAINLSRARIDMSIENMRQAEGVPAEQVNKIRLVTLSKLHGGVIDAALASGNIEYAAAYAKQYGDEIDANTLLKANSLITKQATAKVAFDAGMGAVNAIKPTIDPSDADRIVNITAMSESGNKDFNKDGTPVTSPTGVKYAMQVQQSTARAPGYGIKPADESGDEKQKAAEYNRVGRELLSALLQKNGGDIAKMWAGYNGGKKYVEQATAAASKNGTSWIQELPAFIKAGEDRGEVPKGKAEETLAYVEKNMKAYKSGQGTPTRATFADVDNQLKSNPVLMSNPDAYKQAREIAKQQFDELETANKKRKEETEGEIYKHLVANGGDFYAVPVALRSAVDQEKIPKLMKDAADIKQGVPTVTDPVLYQKLTTNPAYLKSLSENQLMSLRGDLKQEDFKHFLNEWSKLNGKTSTAVEGASDINTQALNAALNQRLSTMGVDPTPKDTDKNGMARVGAVRQFVTRSILDAQAQTGKKFTDADTIKHIDNLFAQSTEMKGFFTGSRNVALLSMKPGDVPSDAKSQIKKAFKGKGQPEPSDADILQVYWDARFNPKKSVINQAKAPGNSGQNP